MIFKITLTVIMLVVAASFAFFYLQHKTDSSHTKISALFDAITIGDSNKVKTILVEHAIDINNVYDEEGSTPLTAAIHYERSSIVKMLISYGADPNKIDNLLMSPLRLAAITGNYGVFTLLIKNGARFSEEKTLIIAAAHGGNSKIVKQLRYDGADVNVHDANGMAPLHEASTAEVAELLIKAGASINDKDHNGDTPLHTAVRENVEQSLTS
ncbi:MAG TPA: ankyrin repeat domain-containing protein [Armatimonadota bacterium]|nr:ankyrin repeat domain-containing protein [Armatimonadota bacterium]